MTISATGLLIKRTLVALNVIIFVSGLIMLIAGSAVQSQINERNLSRTIAGYSTSSGSLVCIVFGLAILVLSVIGLYATLKDSPSILVGYSVFLFLVFLIQMFTGIAGLSVKASSKFSTFVEQAFVADFSWNVTSAQRRQRDEFQRNFECCGWKGARDSYMLPNNTLDAPSSCCSGTLPRDPPCDPSNASELFKDSCNIKLIDVSRSIIDAMCSILVTFSILNVVSVVASCVMARMIRISYQYT